jgi:DNA replication protein DnaC
LPPSSPDAEDFACMNCHDGGFIRLAERGELGHPQFGQVVPCPECAGVIVAQGIPGYLQMASFQSFDLHRNPTMRDAVSAVKAVANGESWCCLLTGKIGVGKTHLAVAALRFNTLPKPGRFWQVGDLLQMFRDRMFHKDPERHRDEYELMAPYRTMPGLLVLDDIGAGTPDSAFTERVLYTIVNARYTERLPTLLTSNDRIDDRIFSRLRDNMVQCDGEDQRGR